MDEDDSVIDDNIFFNDLSHNERREFINRISDKINEYETHLGFIKLPENVSPVEMKLYIDILKRKVNEYRRSLLNLWKSDDDLLHTEKIFYNDIKNSHYENK